MKKVALSFVAVAALTAGVAQAAPKTEGAYVFGNYTHANLKSSVDLEDFDHTQSKNSFGLGGGYRFNENFALEAGYKGLGKDNHDFYEDDTVNVYSDNLELKGQALVTRAIGIMPITKELSLEGFAGVTLAKVDGKRESSKAISGGKTLRASSAEASKTALAPNIGVGATYAINDDLTAFARYEYIALPKIEDITMKSHSVDIGLRYHF